MSLVGFKAQNHPQQIAKDEVDDRAVTPEDFALFHARFRFTVDAAASPTNARLPRYWTREDDALEQNWTGSVWCNPPYSEIAPWVRKAWREWNWRRSPIIDGNALDRIVMLLPNNRCEQGWWQELVEPHLRVRSRDFRVEFLPGRMRFIRPNAVIGPKGDRPPFGCCLLIWGSCETPGAIEETRR
jgi:phage N-6-adenine-methyltransferase